MVLLPEVLVVLPPLTGSLVPFVLLLSLFALLLPLTGEAFAVLCGEDIGVRLLTRLCELVGGREEFLLNGMSVRPPREGVSVRTLGVIVLELPTLGVAVRELPTLGVVVREEEEEEEWLSFGVGWRMRDVELVRCDKSPDGFGVRLPMPPFF